MQGQKWATLSHTGCPLTFPAQTPPSSPQVLLIFSLKVVTPDLCWVPGGWGGFWLEGGRMGAAGAGENCNLSWDPY